MNLILGFQNNSYEIFVPHYTHDIFTSKSFNYVTLCLSLIIHVHPTIPIHRFSKCRSLTLRICDCPHSPQNVGWIGTAYFDNLRVINELLGLWSQSTSKIMHRVKHVVKVCPGLSNRWKVITETMLKLSLNTPVYGTKKYLLLWVFGKLHPID